MMKKRCQAITLSNKKCHRTTDKKYCYQHKKKSENVKKVSVPWKTIGLLPKIIKQNPKGIISRINTLLKRGPTKNDKPGHIYSYYLNLDEKQGLSYYKIGRTEQKLHIRLSQWKGSVLKKGFPVSFNRFAERLIHLSLAFCRIYRYEHENGYHSVKALSGKVVEDSQKLEKLGKGHKKHIEWFNADFEDIIYPMVVCIVKIVNNWEKKRKKI